MNVAIIDIIIILSIFGGGILTGIVAIHIGRDI